MTLPRKILLILATILTASLAAGGFAYDFSYRNRILPNISIGSLAIGGMTLEEAEKALQNRIDQIENEGLVYQYAKTSVRITPTIISPFDKDASYRILDFDIDATLAAAFQQGHEGSFPNRMKAQWQALKKPSVIPMSFILNEAELYKILESKFDFIAEKPQNASISITDTLQILIQKEKPGSVFDYPQAIQLTKQMLFQLAVRPVTVALNPHNPEIRAQDIAQTLPFIQNFLKKSNLTLIWEQNSWSVPRFIYKNWLAAEKIDDFNILNPSVKIIFDNEKTKTYLSALAPSIDIQPRNAKFRIENNRVIEFQTSLDGRKLDSDQTVQKMTDDFIGEDKPASELVVVPVLPEKITANDLGIEELIGVGISNFKWSPMNRVHNIKVGAAALHGILIPPLKEFSLLEALGDVGPKTGYKQELVIKGDKTIPEYGGGLCQIGTTTFRAALASGLPITERRNHSYRVTYYEPAGTDATIYFPNPDFKFINDTGHSILIQTKIVGYDLFFEFWGTKDQRIAEQTKPIIYNITKPPEPKTIETTDLKPGEKKCTEKAHNGADAKFTYKVTYKDGAVKEQTFRSHYIPWQEVCLVGVEPKPPEPPPAEAVTEPAFDPNNPLGIQF
ncbi:MAG: VanW family protein [Parcubacteria group bacterium]|nr:VanW family protein [Parcubacteria group bacterium]